jgi:PIN domain nuclease of toxin-antitoxin system
MKVLADTHALIWWLEDSVRLSAPAASILADRGNSILISTVVGWEIAMKVGAGKMQSPFALENMDSMLKRESFLELPISMEAGVCAGLLPHHHRDPFDRLLIAQAQLLKIPVLTGDRMFDRYGVDRLW